MLLFKIVTCTSALWGVPFPLTHLDVTETTYVYPFGVLPPYSQPSPRLVGATHFNTGVKVVKSGLVEVVQYLAESFAARAKR
jgi:hypothetical protein